jgi:hypothetical protein
MTEDALRLCPEFDAYKIRVEWAEGGQYVCRDFQVEERSLTEFLIYCEGPFTYKIPGASGPLHRRLTRPRREVTLVQCTSVTPPKVYQQLATMF